MKGLLWLNDCGRTAHARRLLAKDRELPRVLVVRVPRPSDARIKRMELLVPEGLTLCDALGALRGILLGRAALEPLFVGEEPRPARVVQQGEPQLPAHPSSAHASAWLRQNLGA